MFLVVFGIGVFLVGLGGRRIQPVGSTGTGKNITRAGSVDAYRDAVPTDE
jgi:hypothetical protein